jgi:very-short-patch-repair endonuclease
MRSAITETERRLWTQVRGKRFHGLKFYRQVPIGPYIVDFISHFYGLVIEVDGVTHGRPHEIAYDATRDAYLERLGLRVLRVPGIEVLTNMDGVLDGIMMVIQTIQKPCERRWLPSKGTLLPPRGG